ncbi:hypothetical protein [Mesorhizobium sp. M8A.F.Ca.ET.142.01.1.1]|nr:hypothetical protein [Mesorhizobium sp. M8A.F.Ca.ET.142.01.1.1]TGQ72978.1 hypothetical protein EN848_06555 [bacterium M00.F.Ca.ET.205.01.1.1]TGT92145.1 hypothetical protein EN804_03590 [Mesorhizobium sp. M8A.F.Ca.ET.161.01.1.1]TGU53734.1 hypothetical protein EN795_10975 [bacterium M00.F.Ca.ET.152.01.1.1]TGV37234.1 hypothetical protein EN829_011000 [Mesorhizobium sp. M00.F.Ca.ET.186.01.1.1]TGZ39398.1 hypothetical protein EN805_29015 [bacterium M00.F.Ca.ET.162.01.1.1]
MTRPEAMASGGPLATPITVDEKVYWVARSRRGILKRLFLTQQDAAVAASNDDSEVVEIERIAGEDSRAILRLVLDGQTILLACNPLTGKVANLGIPESDESKIPLPEPDNLSARKP